MVVGTQMIHTKPIQRSLIPTGGGQSLVIYASLGLPHLSIKHFRENSEV